MYLEIDSMVFKDIVDKISSLAYFVGHLHIIFEPSEVYSDETHQKIIKATNYLNANNTKQILKKVSLVIMHKEVTYLN